MIKTHEQKEWDKAYEAGYRLGSTSCGSVNNNPYPKGSQLHNAWRTGFRYHKKNRVSSGPRSW